LTVLKNYGYTDDHNREAKEEASWNELFDQLVGYKQVQGRFVVSKNDTVYPKLSQWIADQRKMEKQGRLSIGRKQRLLERASSQH
jgi:hypothetical protein